MDNAVFDHYKQCFLTMKRAFVKGYSAPHKPILLLAICDLIEEGEIQDNRIFLSTTLEKRFERLWKIYVDSDETIINDSVAEELFEGATKTYPFKCNIANPFFHLSTESFWSLVKAPNWRQRSSWSLSALRSDYEYAVIDPDLFALMNSCDSRDRIKELLMSLV